MASAHYHAGIRDLNRHIEIPDCAYVDRPPFLLRKISTGCKMTRLGTTAKSVAYLAYARRKTLKQKVKGSKRNHEQHLWHGWTGSSIGSGVIHGGDARPGIDGPRRFDRRAGGGNNHLDL